MPGSVSEAHRSTGGAIMSQAGRNLNGALASLAGIAAVCAALSAPAPAWADYDAKSTDGNVLESCTDFRTDASGVLSANCNEWDNDKVQSVEARTIDLDEKIGVKDGKLEYNGSNFSDECRDETANWNASELALAALCAGQIVGIPAGRPDHERGVWRRRREPGSLLDRCRGRDRQVRDAGWQLRGLSTDIDSRRRALAAGAAPGASAGPSRPAAAPPPWDCPKHPQIAGPEVPLPPSRKAIFPCRNRPLRSV